ncbi:MAG: hypothetical protein LBF83_02270, partial [Spirochaetaceae bacterium]|nr:hypothetical protein [Spirochaetaceae bacterium]
TVRRARSNRGKREALGQPLRGCLRSLRRQPSGWLTANSNRCSREGADGDVPKKQVPFFIESS